MKTYLITLSLVSAYLCGCVGNALHQSDKANIQGSWLAQTESQDGRTRNVTYQYVFSGDKVTFKDEFQKEMKYSFKLDTANNPKLITIWPAETLASSSPVSVAYELDGDSLKIVVAPAGLHPTDISDKNNQELITCTREAPSSSP